MRILIVVLVSYIFHCAFIYTAPGEDESGDINDGSLDDSGNKAVESSAESENESEDEYEDPADESDRGTYLTSTTKVYDSYENETVEEFYRVSFVRTLIKCKN